MSPTWPYSGMTRTVWVSTGPSPQLCRHSVAPERGATLFAEFGEGQGEAIGQIFESANWQSISLLKDLSGKDRVLSATWPKETLSFF